MQNFVRRKFSLCVVAPLAVAGLLSCGHDGQQVLEERPQSLEQVPNQREYVKYISEYVRETKGWSIDNFVVTYGAVYGDLLIFEVIYQEKGAQTPSYRRDPRSFGVYFDPAKKKVVKEFGLQ